MDGWLTYEAYQARYPDSTLDETPFLAAATDAWFCIQEATHWRASLAASEAEKTLLAECQAQLVHRTAESPLSHWDGVASVSNHGYSETYASGQDVQTYLRQQQGTIVARVLRAPATAWMLYAGGVYRPRRR